MVTTRIYFSRATSDASFIPEHSPPHGTKLFRESFRQRAIVAFENVEVLSPADKKIG
jgi:hypothetical protein